MDDKFKEILKSILQTKKSVELNPYKDYKEYPAFAINRVLSKYKDAILYANMMNMNHHIPKNLQYQYLLNTVRSMKRPFQKSEKEPRLKDLDCVKEYFGYSNEKAKEALRILTDEQIAFIKQETDRGGVRK